MIPSHIPTAATTSASLLYGLIGIYVALASVGLLCWIDRRVRRRQETKTPRRPSSLVTSTDLAIAKRMERDLGDLSESLTGLRAELVCWRDATGQSAADIKRISQELDGIDVRLSALESQANKSQATEMKSDQSIDEGPSVLSIFGSEALEPNATQADGNESAAPTEGVHKDMLRGWIYDQAPPHADDLTQIWGIGPSYEKRLQESGIYRFSQIASWSDTTIDHFEDAFSFKGRIRRENWVGQAERLGQSEAA